MKYIYIVFVLLVANLYCYSQVKVSPLLDLSYNSYELTGANSGFSSNSIDIGFGVSSLLPISKTYCVLTKFAYYQRAGGQWTDCSFTHCTPSTFKHNDLNVHFSLVKKLKNKLHFGIGPTISRKVNSFITVENFLNDGMNETFAISNVNLLLNGVIVYEFNFIAIGISYLYKLNNESYTVARIKGRSEVLFTISYPINLGN